MTIVGTAEVQVIATAGNLDKDIANIVKPAVAKAEKQARLTPRVDTAQATNESKKLTTALSGVSDKLKGVALAGGPAASRLAQIVAGARGLSPAMQTAAYGAAAFTAAALLSINATVKLGSEVRRFNAITRAGAETSSQFVGALHRLGVDPNTVAASFFRLSNTLKTGQAGLAEYGIQVAHTEQGTTDLVGTFLNVADAVARTVDPATRAQIAFAAFGRQGKELLPILAKGRAGLDEFFKGNASFSEADLAAIKAYQQSLRDTGNEVTKLKVKAGTALLPSATLVLGFVNTTLSGVGKVVNVIDDAGRAAGGFARDILGIGHASRSAAPDLNELADAAAEVAAQEAAAVTALRAQASSLRGAFTGLLDAQHANRDAGYGVEKATAAVGDAQERLSTLLRKGAVDSREVASAQASLASSSHGLERARRDLTKAEENLAKVQQGATARELARADLTEREATLQLTRAEKDLADLRRHHRRDTLGIAEAELQVEEARLSQADAQDSLTKTQNQGKEGTDEYAAALDQVQEAHDRVTQAQNDQADSAQRLHDAQRGDPDFAHKVADAKDALRDAERGVTTAKEAQLTASLNLDAAQQAETQALTDNAAAVSTLRAELELLAATYRNEDFGPLLALLPGAGQGFGGDPRVSVSDADAEPPHKAGGGPTSPNTWYQVNERGQEFFRSNSSGTVLPVGQAPRSAGGGQTPVIEQHFHGTDPELTAQRSGYYVGRALRTAPR